MQAQGSTYWTLASKAEQRTKRVEFKEMREKKSLIIIIVLTMCISYRLPFGYTQETAPSPDESGPYEVGRIDFILKKDEYRNLPISIYYPALESEMNAGPFSGDKPYPTLIFTPGNRQFIEPFRHMAQYVSSWGFIYVLVASSVYAVQFDKAEDMILTLDWLSEQNKNESFKLSGFIDENRIGATGFSMGGAAAIVCSAADSRFKVCVPVGGGGKSYLRAIDPSILSLDVPIFITVGSNREETAINRCFEIYEENKVPKYLGVIIGANHSSIYRKPVLLKYVVSFLKVYLSGEEEYIDYLYGEHAQQDIDEGKIELYFDITEGAAVFELNSLTINPSSIRVGDTITVSIDCRNEGNKAGSYTVTLMINGEVEDEKTVTVAPNESTTISFDAPTSEKGIYSVEIEGLTGSYEVVAPASLVTSGLTIEPSTVQIGESVAITIDVSNVGGQEGSHLAVFKVNGVTEDEYEVSLESDVSQTITFEYIPTQSGTFIVDLDGLTGSITVLEPASIDVSNLVIDPESLMEDESVTISVECSNFGGVSGSYDVVLEIDGETKDTSSVTVEAGESTTVSFEVSAPEEGSYSVDVNGLSGSYEVEKAQTGIPGFPLNSIVISVVLAAAVMWLIRRQH